jgi:hypothetical protein
MIEETAFAELENEPVEPVVEKEETTEQSEQPEKQENSEEEKAKAKRRLSDRLKQRTREFRDAERKNQELEAELSKYRDQSKIKTEPKPTDYDDLEKFNADNRRWMEQERERIRKEEREAIKQDLRAEEDNKKFSDDLEAYKKSAIKIKAEDPKYQKYAEEVDDVINSLHAPEIKGIIIKARSLGPEIVRYLGTHTDELEEIASASPFDRVYQMGQLVNKLKAKSVKTGSSAPDPVRSESGSAPNARVISGSKHSTVIKGETFAERAKRLNGR